MIFHPSFTIAREHRLLFEKAGPSPAPEGAPAPELTPERQKAKEVIDALKKQLDGDPRKLNAFKELVVLKCDEAETDEKKFQETYHSALEKAANTYFKSLEGKDEEKAKKVQELFQSAGAPDVRLEGGALVVGQPAPERKEGPVLSPENEQLAKDIVGLLPDDLKTVGNEVVRELLFDPVAIRGAQKFLNVAQGLSPQAKLFMLKEIGARVRGETVPATPPAIRAEIDKARAALGPEGAAFGLKIVRRLMDTFKGKGAELSNEELQDVVEKAQNFLKKKKFDYATATEMQKNLMLAQLQMLGIDVSGGETILKDPRKLQALNGSPMERGFNKILGMIAYILLSIQQMKDRLKPSEKKTDTPAGDKGKKGPEAPSSEKEAMRQKLKEQAKNDGKSMTRLHREKQNQLDEMNKKTLPELRNKIQEIHDANEEAGLKDEDNDELKTKKAELQTVEKEAVGLQAEVTEMDAMKKETIDSSNELNQKQNIVSELLQGLPKGEQKNKLIEALKFKIKPNAEYQLVITPTAGIDLPTAKKNLNAVLSGRLAQSLSETVHFDGDAALKSPTEMGRVFDTLAQSIREDISKKNNPPIAPAAPATAAVPPAPGPTPAGPAPAAPSVPAA